MATPEHLEMPSPRAAPLKPCKRATARTAWSLGNGTVFTRWNLAYPPPHCQRWLNSPSSGWHLVTCRNRAHLAS